LFFNFSRIIVKFFLKKFNNYISPIAKTFVYCLMPNHFHFLVKIKKEKIVFNFFRKTFPKFQTLEKLDNKLISKQFAKLFSCYTQSFNKQNNRKGSLFIKNFKRKNIDTENYLKRTIIYIHQNPVNHGFCDNINKWKYSSYNSIISDKPTVLQKEEVISLFEDIDNFIYCHKTDPDIEI